MGMFDTIHFDCPNCKATIEVQSKGGECLMHNYRFDFVPIESALGITGETVVCQSCVKPFIIVSTSPNRVQMWLIPTPNHPTNWD